MKAIRVRFLGATAKLPCRFVADDGDGNKLTYKATDIPPSEDLRREAAQALADKMQWTGELARGEFGQESFFVFLPDRNPEDDCIYE